MWWILGVIYVSEVLMILTVILSLAALWLGGVAIAEHVYDKGMKNENFPRFIASCGLLVLWLCVSA